MDISIPVLIVDDHQAMRRTIADIMRRLGFVNLSYAEDGLMAWDKLQKTPCELVLLDWNMPQMSGIELLKKIRSSEESFVNVPIMMVTAEAEKELVIEAIQSGATNYIVKPFTPATLERKLQEIFK